MKTKYTLFIFLMLIASASFSQITITTDSVIQTGTCAGSSVIVQYQTAGGSFGFGNTFTAELSNSFGQFTNPVTIGTSNFNFGYILATLPANAQFGFFYRVRVVSSNPAVIGSQSPNTIIITSTPLTANIMAQPDTQLCAGDTITLQASLPNATYQWSTGDTTQSIEVGQIGSYWVKVTDQMGCEARDTTQITVKTDCNTASISGSEVTGAISYYPNPVKAQESIVIKGMPAGYKKAQFVDMLGRTSQEINIVNEEIKLSDAVLVQGLYYIIIIKDNEVLNVGKVLITD
jgi:hypothetical protein